MKVSKETKQLCIECITWINRQCYEGGGWSHWFTDDGERITNRQMFYKFLEEKQNENKTAYETITRTARVLTKKNKSFV